MDFTIDDDVVELAATIADFFDRRGDARAISAGAAIGAAADGARWAALCDVGLPALRLGEPRGVGASVLDATALAEKIGAVLLPEPATQTMVLARVWDEHGGSGETLDALLDGSRILSFAGFERLTSSTDGAVSGRIRTMDDGVTNSVVATTTTGLVLVEMSSCQPRGTRQSVDPTRPTVQSELCGAAPVEELRMTPSSLAAAEREIAVMMMGELVGGMQAVLDETMGYVTERRQFGRSIGSFQAVKHQLADMYVAVEQGRAAVQFAAIGLDQRSETAAADVEAASRWVPRQAIDLFDTAIHLHGAMGYSWEVDVHLHLRRALEARAQLLPRHARRLAS